jgi:hypothetical protein
VRPVEHAVLSLDAATAAHVRPALAWLLTRSASDTPGPAVVREFLVRELPLRWGGGDVGEQHELAWALGDLFERAQLPEQAALCRSGSTHDTLAVWAWTRSFTDVPAEFWQAALRALEHRVDVPPRAALALSSARALLEVVGDGLTLTSAGQLPLATVLALDDRFRWTEAFPWMRVAEEADIAPLRLLHEHLVAQRLLQRDGSRLTRSPSGVACTRSTAALWRALVDPSPRWSREFERDALGVMAASVLRAEDFALGRIGEEMTHVLASKWRPVRNVHRGRLFDGAAAVAQEWYQLGVPLGWWDTGHGPADRRPNVFGHAATVSVFRSVGGVTARSGGQAR